MDPYINALIDHLSGFVTKNRLELFQQVIAERTRYITVLLEDIYQSQNASAVLRTCDCLGIQDAHIVEESNEYEVNPDISLGSNQWLNVHYYDKSGENSGKAHNRKPSKKGGKNILYAVETLRERGYRIVATSPNLKGSTPETFNLEKGKAVIMFGTELNGLTERALRLADEFIRVPMVGFTESFNISVSAAVILYSIRKRLEESSIAWRISEEEKGSILLDWLRNSIRMSAEIERKFRTEWES